MRKFKKFLNRGKTTETIKTPREPKKHKHIPFGKFLYKGK